MFDSATLAKSQARDIVLKAVDAAQRRELLPTGDAPDFVIEVPADSSHGDFATNIALVGAKVFRMAPRQIADAVLAELDLGGSVFERAEIAGAGFINFFLGESYYGGAVEGVLDEREKYGTTDWGGGKKYMVEFVSANPTGPMHLGNARGGAIGDCLASVLEFAGCDVTREFYINDYGNQIDRFGLSLEARYLALFQDGVEFPEDGYHGDDIIARAKEFADEFGQSYVDAEPKARQQALIDFALPRNIERMKDDLHKYRIDYDVWFYESSVYEDGTLGKVMDILKQKGATYEKDGAIWYKATAFGGEKDEVLIRSNGYPTYFAGDIAYHYNKFAVRGFDTVINVWGADHHGHVARLQGAMDAIGLRGDKLDIVLMQLVRLVRDGEQVRMSKRTGKAIGLADLLDEIPIDAARFFFNLREPKSHLEFDLDLAARNDSENPVYYVQYAHARICSVLKNLENSGIDLKKAERYAPLRYTHPDELALIRHISYLPGEITTAASEYDPARITRYVIELATLFHRFYANCRVKEEPSDVMYPRIALCLAAKQVLANCLALLKITAPESM